jgi:flagellar M-ring protein FliF
LNAQVLDRSKQLLAKLPLQRKLALAMVTAVTLCGMFFLVVWANRPEYGLLYTRLEPADAAQIVEDLKGTSVPYKLKDGGTTIEVPSNQIYELRLKYAGKNLVSSGSVGYELFDKNNLGLTEFMQKINLKRALEGELSKTINQIDAVQASRVHLVIAEPSLFADEQSKSSASVILKVKGNGGLDSKQIQGIAHMVASSVEGLAPEDVVIMDSHGAILSKVSSGPNEIGMSNSQLEMKETVERYLSQKAQSMLDVVLGANNSIVRVAATLNFDKVNRTSETFDPENTAVLSEERNEERSSKPDTVLYQHENVVTNYEINKIVEQYQGSVGDIKQISIAVFVNNVAKVGADNTTEFAVRSEEEIQKITDIVRNAIGFNQDRKDQIVVHQLAFDRSYFDREQELLTTIENKDRMDDYIRLGLIVVGGLIFLLILRSALKKIKLDDYFKKGEHQLGTPRKSERLLSESENAINDKLDELLNDRLSAEARIKLKGQEKINNEVKQFVENESDRAARILRYWMVGEERE